MILVFPSNLKDEAYKDRPTIQFSCTENQQEGDSLNKVKNEAIQSATEAGRQELVASPNTTKGNKINIFLPCPGGITFADSGSYGEISKDRFFSNLTTDNAAKLGQKAGSIAGKGEIDALKSVGEAAGRTLEKVSTQDAVAALSSNMGPDIGQQIQFGNKVIMDPRINTAFTGNGLRTFSFEFKMIATSQQESMTVKNIYNAFRRNIYASRAGLIALRYPPVWEIKFLKGDKSVNQYIPKIHKCYLTSVNTTFNSENNSWRVDTAPLSVDISISFQEQKVLTRQDIENLEEQNPDLTGAGNVGFLNSLQGNFKKSINKKLDSLKNEVRDIFRF